VPARSQSPNIVIFACSWYPLTAIDNAGEDGCRYPTSTTVIPLECGGSLTTAALLQALAGRADGVLVTVCGEGDCHYANGNDSCAEVVLEARRLAALAGIEPERLRLEQSSNVDGGAFAALVTEFAADVGRLNGKGRSTKRRARGRPKARSARPRAREKPKPRPTRRRAG
jgi:F420-non-reducing hydrogenase iron-sulfur subunit